MNNLSQFGFTLTKQTPLPELDAVLYQMTHEKTGLELVWLKRDEENKTFGIAFKTVPWNDTGVFHILEHSVLNGSDLYPVKEPFVELLKSSLNTFLNAMTFPDKTLYPVSSRNDKDFINLMRVYLDAVFHPLIYSKPEIFYQEGWHYELDEAGQPSYKGVVFNEMKGAFASADELVSTELGRILFPDSPYGYVAGGDPASIPDLTYEAFIDSHRRFYSPSNGYIFLDGDLDLEQVLAIIDAEYLSHYEKTQPIPCPAMQSPVTGCREGFYELAPGEDLAGKTRLSFGKGIGSYADREKLIATQVLAEVLCGSNQSPLNRAVLSEGLAEEVSMDIHDGTMQSWLVLDVKNLREEDLDKVESLIRKTLTDLAETGLDHSQLEAVMANTEFKMRERDYGNFPQGIIFSFTALETWLYGGDPATNFQVGDLFVRLREKMQAGYFEDLIRQILLDNPHSGKLILRPSYSAGEERRAREQARLADESARWTPAQRQSLVEKQEKLLAWQESQDTPEVLATIPQLSLSDIPAEPERIPTEVTEIAGIPVLRHDLHTGGIVYVNLYFDADGFHEEELSYLSFLCELLGETDTADHTAEEIINRTRLLCGGFDASPTAFLVGSDPKNVTTKLHISFSTLEENLPAAMAHITKILTGSRFRDEAAHDILRQAKMAIFQRAVMAGHSVGTGRILAQFSPAGVVQESIGGVCYYQWLKNTDENWDFAAIEKKLQAISEKVINKNCLTVSVGGGSEACVKAVMAAVESLPAAAPMAKATIAPWGKRKEGIAIPADIAFAVLGGDLHAHGGAFSGQMQLASQIISLSYLWNVVRVQGGAYGVGMQVRESGLLSCYSYRDPNGAGSVERYRDSGAFLREMAESGEELTGFIIGAVAGTSPLMTPRTKASVGDSHYFCRTTWEDRCEKRRQLLGATAEDLLAAADVLEKTLNDGGICIIGGQEQLAQCPELETIVTL